MSDISLTDYSQLMRFFEKQVEWLGLPRNTGPVLTVLYLARYKDDAKMSIDDIADATHYSRSNVSLVVSQLETLGLIYGETDLSQTGRGRRRVLYSVDETEKTLIGLGVDIILDRLNDTIQHIDQLIEIYGSDSKFIAKMLKEFKKDAKGRQAKLLER